MRMTIALRVLGALLLLGSAALVRNEARLARAEAAAWQELATLRYDAAATSAESRTPSLRLALTDPLEVSRREATRDYWLGRYDDLTARDDGRADADVLFVAANAAYRVARREAVIGPDTARRLDGVLQAYAAVLKAAPRHADAAYNFEYVARLRDYHARMKPPAPSRERPTPRGAPPLPTEDLPRGPTVHGRPGGPPPETKSEEFEILTPRDLGEREADPEQAPGARVRRKG
jgi:hypothetical protein